MLGGSFSGTLRASSAGTKPAAPATGSSSGFGPGAAGSQLASSAGRVDGFIAKLSATGDAEWLVRMGGPGADAIEGVAAAGDRIAFAGTFAGGSELLGQPIPSQDERSPLADVVVGELDPRGARRWLQTFGGESDDAATGVAIDGAGRVVVSATVRHVVRVNGQDLVARGDGDGLVAWWSADGVPGPAVLLGGDGFDGLTGIAAVGDRVVVGGFSDNHAELTVLDATGVVSHTWPVTADGRADITALAPAPGGFIAGVAHTTAATLNGVTLPSPEDPIAGTALVIRVLR